MRCFRNTAVTLTSVLVLLTNGGLSVQASGLAGWTGVSIDSGRRVIGAQTLVDLSASNTRRCLRMCWLFQACAAVTFTLSRQRCQLFVLSGSAADAYRLAVDSSSESADMRRAQINSVLNPLRGCDMRPCSESELCAPVRYYAVYVCIQLASNFCSEDPPTVANSETERDNIGSVVYSCAQGYFQTGTNHISYCNRITRTWSAVDTNCALVNCGQPPVVTGANPNGMGTTLDSVVTYTCLAGSAPSSIDMTSTCVGSSGQWLPVPEPCVAVICPDPPAADLMNFEITSRTVLGAFPGLDAAQLSRAYGGEALYTCKDGYTAPEGASYISQCQEDGTWSSTANFLCSPVDCGEPEPSLVNASHVNYTTTTMGAVAIAACPPGFSPSEGIKLTCNKSGDWEGPGETCVSDGCGAPPQVAFATIDSGTTSDSTSTLVGSVVNYRCLEAAVPTSNVMSSTCLASTRTWSPVLPCEVVFCPEPPAMDGTVVRLKDRASLADAIPGVDHEQLQRAYGGEANYTCKDGYKAPEGSGSNSISQCQADSTWSPTINFACSLVDCGQPATVTNSITVNHTTTLFGDTVNVQCLRGFSPVQGFNLTCTATGDWDQGALECEPLDCGAPPSVDNATIGYTETVINSTANYSCVQPAVVKEGVSFSTCLDTGKWSSVTMSCVPVPCGPAREVNNSEVQYTTVNGQIRAEFTCHAGFRVADGTDPYNVCINFERQPTWSDNVITCNAVACDGPPKVANTIVGVTGSAYPYKAVYTCSAGYDLTSIASSRTCQADGTWSTEEVVCSSTSCAWPDVIDNAQSDASYTAVTFPSGQVVSIYCYAEFTMVSANSTSAVVKFSTITCENGNWTSLNPQVQCIPFECGYPPAVPLTTWTLGPKHTLVYECIDGYQAAAGEAGSGTSTSTNTLEVECDAQSGWKLPGDLEGVCIHTHCGEITTPENSPLYVPRTYVKTYGSKVEVSCTAPMYQNSPDNVTTCQADGKWSAIDPGDLCAPCNQSTHASGVPNGLLQMDAMASGFADRARFTCESDYQAFGAEDELVCRSVNNSAAWQGLEDAQMVLAFGAVRADGTSYQVFRVDYNGQDKLMSVEQNSGSDDIDSLQISELLTLIELSEKATFCLQYEMEQSIYQLTRNGQIIIMMPAVFVDIHRFATRYSVKVSLITLNYST
ncbi:hypothetical protein EGW08_006415 [Elysia chlorotica]|uniref:Sushi domain-containing protein n=1 Tax=Elysia chlorotica TaxID=188477 RepID=A0A433TW39_ELYCH|nr:hypothetical protein EGW08_006415 [Elysia chlorotica]